MDKWIKLICSPSWHCFPRPQTGHVDPADFEVNGSAMEGGQSGPQVRVLLCSHTSVCVQCVMVELFVPALRREGEALAVCIRRGDTVNYPMLV